MLDFTINTYWNVETLYYVFNAVAAMMNSSAFAGLIKMVFVFATGVGMFAYMGGKQLEMAQWFIQALIFTTLLNLPIARVTFVDTTGVQPPRVVANVPFVMAAVGETVNMTFGFITRQYETAFGVPDQIGIEQGDIGFGHRILKQINHAEIQDAALRADLMQFIKECTIYDIKDGEIAPQEIMSGTDLWNALFTKTSPARFVTYNTLTASPVTDTCQNIALILKDRVNNAVTAAQTFYGKQAFPLAQSDALATSMFIGAAGASYDWILQSSQNASDALRQSMFNNIWRQAGSTLPAMLNDPAQVAEVAALTGEAQAAMQANGSNSVLSLLGQETLPHMRNWLEAILYAMFPVVLIVMIASSAEGAKKVLGGYVMSLAWIGMWPVLFAVINHLSLMYLKHKANALALSSGVPFQLSDVFDSTLVSEQAQIGYMVVLVPFIAGAIVRMGQGGFMHLADKAISGFSSTGAAAGSTTAIGNVSMGQAGLDTQSVNATSMHRMDYNTGLQGGGASVGTGSGGVMRIAANGNSALEQMNNRFITSLMAESSVSSQRSEEANAILTAGTGSATMNRQSESGSFNQVTGHENTRGTTQTKGMEASDTRQGSVGGTSDVSQSLHTSDRDAASFVTSVGARDNLQMGASARLGVGGGGGGKTGKAVDENRIAKTMQNNGASQQEIDRTLEKLKGDDRSALGGRSMGANAGIDISKYYSAEHNRNKSHEQSHTSDERTNFNTGYQETSSKIIRDGESQNSGQNNRESTDASRSSVIEHAQHHDATTRDERAVGNRTSRGESHSFSERRDLLSDTHFMEQVARRNGMTPQRFYAQGTSMILAQAQMYAEETDALKSSKQLNNATFSGDTLPTNKSQIQHQAIESQDRLRMDVDRKHQLQKGKTGFQGSEPIPTNIAESTMFKKNKELISKNVDATQTTSLPGRAAAFDENVQAWASYDKKPGEGRANPMQVVEAAEILDLKDTGRKALDLLTGGDGTADGEKLNDNKKRENNSGF